jgi:hypothetical protein
MTSFLGHAKELATYSRETQIEEIKMLSDIISNTLCDIDNVACMN